MAAGEFERIEFLRRALQGVSNSSEVSVGIGDDAAVLTLPSEPIVWTVDSAIEQVHFRLDWLSFEDVGFRSTMAAASDIAAMAARPIALLAALVLPPDFPDEHLRAIAEGQRQAAVALGAPLVGGNLSRGAELSITTTVLGATSRPILRSGAREGDAIWLAGPVGLAAAGLRSLTDLTPRPPLPPGRGGEKRDRAITTGDAGEALLASLEAWRRPTARIAEGLSVSAFAHAAIDVSDGLAQDLDHMATASNLLAVLDPSHLVSKHLAELAAALATSPLELALHGGEDYALIVALDPGASPPGFVRIGRFESPTLGATRVALEGSDGELGPVELRGYDHFGEQIVRPQ